MKVPNLLKSILLFAVVFTAFSFAIKKKEPAVLIFSKTNGYRHQSIPAGIEAIKKLGLENKFTVDATEDSLMFTDANLAKYKAIIFLSPTMDVLGEAQQKAMENYIHKGGGFVGIHAAADCEYDFPWYVKMIGASFKSHPDQQLAKLQVIENTHKSTKHLPSIWERSSRRLPAVLPQ